MGLSGATTHALQSEGSSTIQVSDRELADHLDNRRVGSVKVPASRVLQKEFRLAAVRVRHKHHEASNHVATDPDQDTVRQGNWLAEQVAAGRPMSELTDIVFVNGHVVPLTLPDILLRARDGETWAWTDTATGALTRQTSQEAIDQARTEKPLLGGKRHARSEVRRHDGTTQ